VKTSVTICRNEFDLPSTGGRTSAEIRILNDQAFVRLPELFEKISEQIASDLLACGDSEPAFSLFKRILSAEALAHDFKTDWDSRSYQFVCTPDTKLNEPAILAVSEDKSDDLARLGLNRKMWGGDDYPYCGFGVKDCGELISWCVENSHFLAESETIVGVRTEEAYRRKGYALSNTVCLCRKLLWRGMTRIFYECGVENRASFGLARKAGLAYIGERLYIHLSFKI
jgi:RimJ/RimL family protein N-acetyltransferase